MTTDLKGLERKLGNVADDLTGTGMERALDHAGELGVRIADDAVAAALGDMSFSNWDRGRQIQIRTRFRRQGDHEITFGPAGDAAGPAQVLDGGRQSGVHGVTRGWGVWATTTRTMGNELPAPIADHVHDSLSREFGD